jgi:predicted metal-dependent enzyme (double-stranded beta helix superfamily)
VTAASPTVVAKPELATAAAAASPTATAKPELATATNRGDQGSDVLDIDGFVAECRAALSEAEPRLAVADLLERTVDQAPAVEAALPAERAELVPLHVSPDLTVLKVVWTPDMSIWPHDHRMWAAIGIYAGQEDNTFFRRVDENIEARRTRELSKGDVVLMGDDTVHAVHNPLATCTAAIHVYGGDFFTREMSQWDPDTLEPQPATRSPASFFEEANERLGL